MLMSTLNANVLVLNKSWVPVGITTVRNALTMLCVERAEAISHIDFNPHTLESWIDLDLGGKTIKSQYINFPVPEIIRLLNFNRVFNMKIPFSRENLYKRDKSICQYCGKQFPRKELSIDHVIPRSKGGKTCWENCVLSCLDCNAKKGNKTLKEAGMRLLKKPKAPSWALPLPSRKSEIKDSWSHFLKLKD